MIVRVVLAAVTATALMAASSPAASTARADRADAAMQRQVSAIAESLQSLVTRDDATPAGDARRVVTLRVPERTVTTAGVDRLTIRTADGGGVATWTVANRGQKREPLVDVPVRPADGALGLRDPGVHKLVFTLTTVDGRRVVSVRRLGSAMEDDS